MKAVVKLPDLYEGMNGTERARAIILEAMKRNQLIADWRFEKITLKLADDTRYTPDFWVIRTDGSTVFEEVKGFFREDAKVKIKVAAAQFPEFDFIVARLVKGDWQFQEF